MPTTVSDGLVLGGLAGWNAGEIVASVADCTTGPVGGGEGLPTTAGLVGINRGLTDEDSDQSRATISLSFALGTVRYGLNCGGLVGTNDGGIRTSFSRAPIEAEQAFSARSNVGGIAGRNRGTVERSFAAGRIDADGSERAGALVGSHRSGTIAECYWDRSATTREAGIGHSVMGGEVVGGYETDQLQGASAAETMAAFDFENTWTTVTDPDDYPTLAWTEVENAPDYDAWTDDDALPGFGLLTTAIAIGGVAYVVGRRFGTASTRS